MGREPAAVLAQSTIYKPWKCSKVAGSTDDLEHIRVVVAMVYGSVGTTARFVVGELLFQIERWCLLYPSYGLAENAEVFRQHVSRVEAETISVALIGESRR